MTPEEAAKVLAIVEWPDRENIPGLDHDLIESLRKQFVHEIHPAPKKAELLRYTTSIGRKLKDCYEDALFDIPFLPPELSLLHDRLREELPNKQPNDQLRAEVSAMFDEFSNEEMQELEEGLKREFLARTFRDEDVEALSEALQKAFGENRMPKKRGTTGL